MRSSKNVIKEFMRFKVRMEGTVNGHEFEIEGEGEGRPYEGHNTVKLKVTKGGPLPFAWDILSPQFQYGSKVYVKHPADIPDYKKLSFPEGFKWERVMNFEDGGVVTVTQDSSLQDGCFIYKVKFIGVNFPSDGPVMQKKTMGWEASTERLYPRDGVLKGEIHKALKLKDGGHYLVEFKSIYMAKKPVQLPGYYYVDSKLDITSHNEDYTIVEQYERTEGRHHLFLSGSETPGTSESATPESGSGSGSMASNFTQFVLVDNGGTGDVTVAPSNFANGIAEWISSNSRSQAYKVTCSVRQSSAQNRKYTIKVEVPKGAWRSYLNMELTIPIFATNSDCELIVKAMQGLLKDGNPIPSAIAANSGIYGGSGSGAGSSGGRSGIDGSEQKLISEEDLSGGSLEPKKKRKV